MSSLQKEKATIRQACQPGGFHTWSPASEVRITRRDDGRVELYFPGQDRPVYQALYAYVQALIEEGKAKDLRDKPHQEPRWTFSFMPVQDK